MCCVPSESLAGADRTPMLDARNPFWDHKSSGFSRSSVFTRWVRALVKEVGMVHTKAAGSFSVRRIATTALAVVVPWATLARAADPDKDVRFDVAGVRASVVLPTAPPSDEELAGDNLFQFVAHHATTGSSPAASAVGGGLLRWRGGRPETICPQTTGLDKGYNEFVSTRIRAVAEFVGAPVQPDLRCKPNLQVMFTADPHKPMEKVLKWAAGQLGVNFPHQMQQELTVSANHAIQGWYITAAGGGAILNRDADMLHARTLDLRALWPRVIPTSSHDIDSGRGILSVILVIDTTKVAGDTIGPIADYIAMVSLTLVQSPDHCDRLRSILDLMSSSCRSRLRV